MGSAWRKRWRGVAPDWRWAYAPMRQAWLDLRQLLGISAERGLLANALRIVLAVFGLCIFVGSALIALVGIPHLPAKMGEVASSLGRGLLTTLAVALLAYIWFYTWMRFKATRALRERARSRPETLFPIQPRVGRAEAVIGRVDLVSELAAGLRYECRTGPQVLIGDTGSGKTSVLLALAKHLADRDVLPIVVTLRDAPALDFAEMAEARFKEYVDPHVRSVADAEKLWRWVCWRGRVAILADDLDRAKVPGMASDAYKTAGRVALQAACRSNLPLIVASRPEGLPPKVEGTVIELAAHVIPEHEAVARLLGRSTGKRPRRRRARDHEMHEDKREREAARERELVRERVRENVVQGRLTTNPFYLGLVADLLRGGSLEPPPSGGEHAVRIALLRAWRERLLGGYTVTREDRRRREALLDDVAHFAAARLAPDSSGAEPAPALSERQWLPSLHAAEGLDLLELDEEGRHRFKHDAMHAYFASLVRSNRRRLLLDALARAPDAPRVQLALVFAVAALPHDHDFCREACAALLSDAPQLAGERRLLRAAAAAEIARAGEFHALDGPIASACIAARSSAPPVVRRSALEQLACLSGREALMTLWDYTCDEDYDVRWAAAEKLVERCSEDLPRSTEIDAVSFVCGPAAYKVLQPSIEEDLEGADRLVGAHDDWEPEIVSLKRIAWVLPALRSRLCDGDTGDVAKAVDEHFGALLELELRPVTKQKGLEASLAQGFKVSARLNPGAEIQPALDMLEHATFWYSRLNLLHAITICNAHHLAEEGVRLSGVSASMRRLSEEEEHPFVRAAAELCDRALEEVARTSSAQAAWRYIWEDEGKVAADRPAGLVAQAAQLVGEIVLLLNMNETGDQRRREEFGLSNRLPFCIHASRDRIELFDGCAGEQKCRFGLCPYEPASGRLSAHRELSRAFCRHQRHNANAKAADLWGAQATTRALNSMWSRLESKARM